MPPHNVDVGLDLVFHRFKLKLLRPLSDLGRPDRNLNPLPQDWVLVLWQWHRSVWPELVIIHDFHFVLGLVQVKDPHVILNLSQVLEDKHRAHSQHSPTLLQHTLKDVRLPLEFLIVHVMVDH